MERLMRIAGQYDWFVYDVINEIYGLSLRAPIEVSSMALYKENTALLILITVGQEAHELGILIYRMLKEKIKG